LVPSSLRSILERKRGNKSTTLRLIKQEEKLICQIVKKERESWKNAKTESQKKEKEKKKPSIRLLASAISEKWAHFIYSTPINTPLKLNLIGFSCLISDSYAS